VDLLAAHSTSSSTRRAAPKDSNQIDGELSGQLGPGIVLLDALSRVGDREGEIDNLPFAEAARGIAPLDRDRSKIRARGCGHLNQV